MSDASSKKGRDTRETGALGERIAAARLERAGMRILFRNWRAAEDHRLEIDLIAQDGPMLVFVEVKTLASSGRQFGRARIDARKRAALRKARTSYLRQLRFPPPHRFDAIEVYLEPDGTASDVVHLENLPLRKRRFSA